jgi:hypothetical protein
VFDLLQEIEEETKEIQKQKEQLEKEKEDWGKMKSKIEKVHFPNKIKLDVGEKDSLPLCPLSPLAKVRVVLHFEIY